jgi:hypothetical protein
VERDKENDGFAHHDRKRPRKEAPFGGARLKIETGSEYPRGRIQPNPELFAYVAAQNRLGAPVLFSHKKIAELIDPALLTKKKALERHHLFPRAFLEKNGVSDLS